MALGHLHQTEPNPSNLRFAGYGAAVRAGLVAATSAVVVVMDGDGSLDPGPVADAGGRGRP
jgi:hypothetical protein